jgi:membrane protease subunit (stomatin/prohibitin family)
MEVSAALQEILNTLCSEQYKVNAIDLPGKSALIKKLMAEGTYDEDVRRFGISLVSLTLNAPTLTPESQEKIDKYELGGDAFQQQGVMTDAYADAMKLAANNSNGAMAGFMGMGMANMAGGAMFQNPMMQMQQGMQPGMQPNPQMYQQASAAAPTPAAPAPAASTGATCPKCGAAVAGKFCAECGTKIEAPTKRFCSECGAEVSGKFCAECGTPVQ